MALHEACQVWIEQRITEELQTKGDKSLREIGRMIAAEVERVFEAKVNPVTMFTKVKRAHDSNESQCPTTEHKEDQSKEILLDVENKVREGRSIREAAGMVAEEHGGNPDTLRKQYARKVNQLPKTQKAPVVQIATEAHHYATIAISQLTRIRRDDPYRDEAFSRVIEHIAAERDK